MRLSPIVVLLVGAVLLAGAWRAWGWSGVALAVGGIVMVLLLHFTRLVHVMRQAAQRPKGYVGSAVMLNARLRRGVNLLHVTALTGALGEPLSAPGEEPEVFRWTDGGGSHVTCEFRGGRLVQWTLERPPAEASEAADAGEP